MKKIICFVMLCVGFSGLSASVSAQTKNFLQTVAGRWEGTLEYSDYKTEKRVKLRTDLEIVAAADGNSAKFSYVYDDFGKTVREENEHRIDQKSGKYFIEKSEYSYSENKNQIVLLGNQIDNDRLEPVRTTVTFDADTLRILKETRSPFQFRHEYIFRRKAKSESTKTLSPGEMSADFAVLKNALTALHPGLYLYNSREQIEKYFSELETKIKRPLDEKQFYLLLSQLTARIKCGHTFLNPLNLDEKTAERIFSKQTLPIYFVILDGKIIVTHNFSANLQIKRGDEISAINGFSSKAIIEKLLTVSRGDGNNALGKRLANLNLIPEEDYDYALFDIYFPLFFPPKSSRFALKINHSNGRRKNYSVDGVSAEQRKTAYEKQFGKIPKYEKTWDYKPLSEQTAYLKFGTFAFWNSDFKWQIFLENAFNDLQSKPEIKNLIIDLRGNEGGSGAIRDAILSYVASKPIVSEYEAKFCYQSLRVPDALLPYLSTWDKSFKQPKLEADFFLNEIGLYEKKEAAASDPILPKPNRFTGKVFLLTNAVNSSATFDMAWTFQVNNLGMIIGEPTGGTKRGLNGGQMFFLTLPSSKFEIDLPILHYYHKNFPDEGVTPDYVVKTAREDVQNNKDRQLEFTLKKIAE